MDYVPIANSLIRAKYLGKNFSYMIIFGQIFVY